MENEFTIGQIFSRSIQVFSKNFVFMLIISFMISLPKALFSSAGENWVVAAFSFLVMIVMAFLAQGVVIYGVFQHLTGRVVVFSESLSVALLRFFPLLGVSIVVSALTGVGFLFFIVPGIILQLMFWVAVPVIVVEKGGLGHALQRSRELTLGYRWRILALTALYGLLSGAFSGIEGLIKWAFFMNGDPGSLLMRFLVELPLSTLLSGLVGALMTVMVTVGYYALRQEVEGVAPEDLASVFE